MPETPAELPVGPFDGREAFEACLRRALDAAAQQNWREIVFCDPSFADWPLGDRATLRTLQAWSRSGRRFLLLAQRFDVFERSHARFVDWRRTWSHIVECRVCHAAGAPVVPSAVWTPSWFMQRIDPERSRGVSSHDAERRAALREQIDECWRRGRPGFPATTLGL